MKITMAQQNFTVGDFKGNTKKIITVIDENRDSDFIVFSELSLSGYYPWDLIYRENFMPEQDKALQEILEFSKTTNSFIVVGLVRENRIRIGKPFFNSLVVILKGNILFDYDKKLLPTYNIFDEKRHFEAGAKDGWTIFGQDKTKVGFLICEDGWNDDFSGYTSNPIKALNDANVDYIISINASPANINKIKQRENMFQVIARKYAVPIIYVNQVGANDEIVFDGGSFAFDKFGKKVAQLKYYEEDVFTFDSENAVEQVNSQPEKYEMIFNHIGVGLKDYMNKQGFKKVVVGSSGGIDSALTLALAAIHLGKDNVEAITMPSKWSSEGSVSDSEALCNNLGIKLFNFPIINEVNSFTGDYSQSTKQELTGIAAENLQARIRGTILMAYSNQSGNLLLTTGNKSEISVGYFTLYGDSNGGLNLIGDLYKTEVYALSKWINDNFVSVNGEYSGERVVAKKSIANNTLIDNKLENGESFGDYSGESFNAVIPVDIIDKLPSAELAPDQKDSDSLPDYDHLDAILKKELEWDFLGRVEKLVVQEMIDEVDKTMLTKVLNLIDKAEFKRKQSAPIVRIHSRAFGSGRRVPTVHKLPISI